MSGEKTRCKQCIHSDKTAVESPCSKCGEVQFSRYKNENHFILRTV